MTWLTDVHHKGKHRAENPNNHGGSTLALLSAAVLTSIGHGATPAAADPPGGWDAIIACESGGKNIRTQIPGPFTASGFFQITNGTWARHGGLQFAPTAMQASFTEQRTVANRIFARNPTLSDWASSRNCWANGKRRVTIQDTPPQPQRQRVSAPAKPIPPKPKAQPKPHVARITPPPPRAVPHPAGRHVHIVRRGDNLFRIAGSQWRAVWKLNRGTIGANPNRIYPGQRLTLP